MHLVTQLQDSISHIFQPPDPESMGSEDD